MAWKAIQFKWASSAPLIMHNGQTADPLNKFAKSLKQISSKRNKTDADYEQMARIEFAAGLYMAGDGPIIPSYAIDAITVNSAKKFKEGPLAKSGVFCLRHARLEYDGPRTVEELWEMEKFRHVAIVRVGTARVARTRPVFDPWSAVIELNVETSLVNPDRISEWMQVAGTQVGVGDWRPQHGRFEAKRLV